MDVSIVVDSVVSCFVDGGVSAYGSIGLLRPQSGEAFPQQIETKFPQSKMSGELRSEEGICGQDGHHGERGRDNGNVFR